MTPVKIDQNYVSDDFDLLSRGSVLGLDDPLLKQLWEAYERNQVPTPGAGA